jgi:hypothetical protein
LVVELILEAPETTKLLIGYIPATLTFIGTS